MSAKVSLGYAVECGNESDLASCETFGDSFLIRGIDWKSLRSSVKKALKKRGGVNLNARKKYEGDDIYFFDVNESNFEFSQDTVYRGGGQKFPSIRFIKGNKKDGHLVVTLGWGGWWEYNAEHARWKAEHVLGLFATLDSNEATLKLATEKDVRKLVSLQ